MDGKTCREGVEMEGKEDDESANYEADDNEVRKC